MLILQVSTSYTATSTVASVVCTPSGKKGIFLAKMMMLVMMVLLMTLML